MAGGGAGDLGGWWGEGEAERGYCQNERGEVLHGCFVIVRVTRGSINIYIKATMNPWAMTLCERRGLYLMQAAAVE